MKKKSLVIKSSQNLNILKIPNNFLRASYKCSATTQRMYFYSIFKYLTTPNIDNRNTVSFSFSDFFTDLSLKDGMKTRTLIKESANEILDMKMVIEDNEKQYEAINVFQSAKCIFTETTFSFTFTDPMRIFLDELKEIGFSLFEINDLGKLKSFYAMRYYLVALSFKGFKGKQGNVKNSWYFEYSVEELRSLFDIQPDEYPQIGPFRNIVIDLPLKELNEKNLGIQIVCMPIKKSRKIIGFHFDCIDATKIKQINEDKFAYIQDNTVKTDTKTEKVDDLNTEALEIIAKNPRRFAEILEEERNNPDLFGFSPETNALIRLKEELEATEVAEKSE